MYPFERFTERAKRVLTLAQEEAARANHSYIGTEHLLLGLLRERDSLAAMALNNLGVEIDGVRVTMDSVLGRNERIIIRQIIPTSRVKKVIEIAFEEAQRMGNNYVGTEHILLAILVEGEGIAAQVLYDLGATLDKVRLELERLLSEGPPTQTVGRSRGSAKRKLSESVAAGPRSPGPALAEATQTVIALATIVARAWGAGSVDPGHLEYVLKDPAAQNLVERRVEMSTLRRQMDKGVASADYHEAARLSDELKKLQAEYDRARDAWEKGLGRDKNSQPDSG